MLQCLTRRNPFPWIEMRHGTYKAFKVIINTPPEHEWLARSLLVESIASHFKNRNPRIIAKMLQEPIKSVFVCKI